MMPSTPIGACLAKARGTAMLWNAVCVAIVLLGPGRALGAAVEVDARSAHEAVWKVYGAGTSGTAFAIGDHHFLTCAHVIKGFSDHGATEVVIDRHGSNDRRRLEVNYGHAALTLVQDIALFTTKETVDYYFALAESGRVGRRADWTPIGALTSCFLLTHRGQYRALNNMLSGRNSLPSR